MNESLSILTLLQLPRIGRRTVQLMIKNFSDFPSDPSLLYEFIVTAHEKEKRIPIVEKESILRAMEKAMRLSEASEKLAIKMISILDENFPISLKSIDDPPVLINIRGDIDNIYEKKAVGIIGTRTPSDHGIKIALKLAQRFAEAGFVVVSGLAKGCDTFAHIGALNVYGKTIAVLPNGLDVVCPVSNRNLRDRILENGGSLISEYTVETKPMKNNYIERDRLQSALSKGVIVVESEEKGGTMHTVGFAEKYGKIVGCYRHPQPYEHLPQASGNRMLLSQGKAIPLENNEDILSFQNAIRSSMDYNSTVARIQTDSVRTEQLSFNDVLD